MKLDSSPTPPVVEKNTLIRFLMRHTHTPHSGPKAKEAMSAGSSDRSSLMKLGISGTLKLMNISTVATAPSMAVTVSLRTVGVRGDLGCVMDRPLLRYEGI